MPWWLRLWQCYSNPFNLLLTVVAAVSLLSRDAQATTVIDAMVLLSTLIRFVQEGRSHVAAELLRAMVSNTATVIRADDVVDPVTVAASAARPTGRDVPMRSLAPGDRLFLSAGDMVSADCRVVAAKDLFIDQSAMTGESLPAYDVRALVMERKRASSSFSGTRSKMLGVNSCHEGYCRPLPDGMATQQDTTAFCALPDSNAVSFRASSAMARETAPATKLKNSLINGLPKRDHLALLKRCEPYDLVLADVLGEPGDVLAHAYFPVDGFISLISLVEGSPGIEVGMVGSEGMFGAHLALGVSNTPMRALVQGAGTAWRIRAADLHQVLKSSEPLRRTVDRYLYVLMAQLATSISCVRFHQIGPRLARWLLMTQDRAHSDQFPVTQEFLAFMLGVRRVGVTQAAASLQHQELISYHRGNVAVVDRMGLEAAACGCYAADRLAYAALLR